MLLGHCPRWPKQCLGGLWIGSPQYKTDAAEMIWRSERPCRLVPITAECCCSVLHHHPGDTDG
eukprot:213420-Pelagomonas_calceolata.AAC.8